MRLLSGYSLASPATARATGWLENLSAAAASLTSSLSSTSAGLILLTVKPPVVSVPVLSKAQISAWASFSSSALPFTSTPLRDAAPMPQKKVSGTLTTSAQGQDTVRNTSALCTQVAQSPVIRDGTMATSTARANTAGVYTLAKRRMKFSLLLFLSEASLVMLSMRVTALSSWGAITRASTRPVRFTQDENISSPAFRSRGRLSPVREEVSTVVEPDTISASRGTLSPGKSTMISPTCTVSAGTTVSLPSRITRAVSGRNSARAEMESRLLSTARSANHSPSRYKSITATASGNSPSISAPMVATLISVSSVKISPSLASFTMPSSTSRAAKMYMAMNTTALTAPVMGAIHASNSSAAPIRIS